MERWRFDDPAKVYERIEEQRQRQNARSTKGRAEVARKGLEQLFEGKEMGRRLEIAPHITAALHQWGEWANRPQFWANLNVTPFCKLVGIGSGREVRDVQLDPQSMKIHKTFLRMQCRVTQMVLAGYYVGGFSWDDRQALFKERGISRTEFYEVLRRGSIALFNAAKL